MTSTRMAKRNRASEGQAQIVSTRLRRGRESGDGGDEATPVSVPEDEGGAPAGVEQEATDGDDTALGRKPDDNTRDPAEEQSDRSSRDAAGGANDTNDVGVDDSQAPVRTVSVGGGRAAPELSEITPEEMDHRRLQEECRRLRMENARLKSSKDTEPAPKKKKQRYSYKGRDRVKRLMDDKDEVQANRLDQAVRGMIFPRTKFLEGNWHVYNETSGKLCQNLLAIVQVPSDSTKKCYWNDMVAQYVHGRMCAYRSMITDCVKKEFDSK